MQTLIGKRVKINIKEPGGIDQARSKLHGKTATVLEIIYDLDMSPYTIYLIKLDEPFYWFNAKRTEWTISSEYLEEIVVNEGNKTMTEVMHETVTSSLMSRTMKNNNYPNDMDFELGDNVILSHVEKYEPFYKLKGIITRFVPTSLQNGIYTKITVKVNMNQNVPSTLLPNFRYYEIDVTDAEYLKTDKIDKPVTTTPVVENNPTTITIKDTKNELAKCFITDKIIEVMTDLELFTEYKIEESSFKNKASEYPHYDPEYSQYNPDDYMPGASC